MVLLPGLQQPVMVTAVGVNTQLLVLLSQSPVTVSSVPKFPASLLPQHFSLSSASTAHVRWLPRATCLTLRGGEGGVLKATTLGDVSQAILLQAPAPVSVV